MNPLPYTHLPLAEYARIMGIAPLHFWGAYTSTVFQRVGSCEDVWLQYTWQSSEDMVGRVELAQGIQDAEREIKNVLGYSIAPEWEVEEPHTIWPIHRGRWTVQSVSTDWSQVIAPGRRAVAEIALNAAVAYSDADGDGFAELATITVATDLTDAREIKVYHTGWLGEQEWEIRPARKITIAGGSAIIEMDSWLLIDPALYEVLPTDGDVSPILLDDTTPLVDEVDVYREYNDGTQAHATLQWERLIYGADLPYCAYCSGAGCERCSLITQDGCVAVSDRKTGVLVPYPATYDGDAGKWIYAAPAMNRAFDSVNLWYYAGNQDKRYISRRSLQPLDPYLAQAVVWLATARLNKPICACGGANERARAYQRDLSQSGRDVGFFSRFKDMDIFTNPFGTRDGEVRAWQRVATLLSNPYTMAGGAL